MSDPPRDDQPQERGFRRRTNVVLFALTVASVAWTGASVWQSRWQFAAALLAILVVHEFGHYFAARAHGVTASLPYFLPLPFVSPFGTLGAVILMPDRIRSRRALLDIGAAGPLAGLVIAIPLMLYGLSLSELGPRGTVNYIQEGQCLLYWSLKRTVLGSIPPGQDVYLHPIALAAWTGFLVTFINLLPVGQTDGGHVAFALFGERQNRVGRWLLFAPSALLLYNVWVYSRPPLVAALGEHSWAPLQTAWPSMLSSSTVWIVPQLLLLWVRRRRWLDHPPVEDGALPTGRKIVGMVTLLLFIALFMPSPWVTH